MERNINDKIEGWDISFQGNVHMYCHALSVAKGKYKFSINCEDLPTQEKTIGIWLYSSAIPETMINEIQKMLLKWACKFEVKFQIYSSKEKYITSKQGA